MSHMTKAKTKIQDREALKRALTALGFTVRENCQIKSYDGAVKQCNVVAFWGKHGFGYTDHEAGGMEMLGDFWYFGWEAQSALRDRISQQADWCNMDRHNTLEAIRAAVQQEYNVQVAQQQMQAMPGYMMAGYERLADGTVALTARAY